MKQKIILITTLLISSSLAFSQKNEFVLPTLIKQALEYSPKVKEQEEFVNASEYRKKILESNTKPQVNGELSYMRLDPIAEATFPINGEIRKLQFQPHNNYTSNVNASYVIYDWGKFKENTKKIVLEIQQQKGGIEALKHHLAYQVTQLFYGITFLQKAILVQKEQVELIKENGKIIENRVKNGDALEYDALQVQVRLKNAEIRQTDLDGQLEKQLIFLSSLIGTEAKNLLPNELNLNFSYAQSDVGSAYNEAIMANTDINFLKSKEEILEQEYKISKMILLPQLSSNASFGVRNGYQPNLALWRPNSVLGVKLNIPIYSGKRGEFSAGLAKVNVLANKQSIELQKNEIARELNRAFSELAIAKKKKDLANINIEQAEYALKLAKNRLASGVSTPLEIQTAETNLSEAKFGLLQYDYQICMSNIDIARISGIKFW